MFALGMSMTPEMGQAVDGALDELHETMEPWAAEGGYFNFAERACDVEAILPPTPAGGSARSSADGTPTALIRANHALALTAA